MENVILKNAIIMDSDLNDCTLKSANFFWINYDKLEDESNGMIIINLSKKEDND